MRKTDATENDQPPQKPKKARAVGREIKEIYRLNAENEADEPEFLSAVPIHTNERRYIKQNYGAGLYLIEEKQGGRFKGRYEVSIEDFTEPQQPVIEIEPEEYEIEPEEFQFEPEQTNALQYQLLIEKEKTKRLETELQTTRAGSQNEMQTTVSALERAHEQYRELMLLTLSNAQKPQQDATLQAMNMLEKSFGIVNRAKAISEEISPAETSGGGNSYIADGAKLIDSIGRNLPMLGGLLGGGLSKAPATRTTRAQPAPPISDTGNPSNLAETFAKIKSKENENE